jgi:cytochrome c oxidase cbb3-type subunit 3
VAARAGRRDKKKLSCRAEGQSAGDAGWQARLAEGRRLYNLRCYFCHGYSGDARTQAADYLDPPPRDFTQARDLDRARIVKTLREGRPATAMQSFRGLLQPREMEALADYLLTAFVACREVNTLYHTAANGWPDHRARNGRSFPFVLGAISPNLPESALTPAQRQGLTLFRQACSICHEGAAADPLRAEGGKAPQDAHETYGEQDAYGAHDDAYGAKSPHDIAPRLTGLSAEARRGETLYQRDCAYCHAADGTGKNWIGRFLDPHPTDFTAPAWARDFAESEVRRTIHEGIPQSSMPAFGAVLSQDEVSAIVAYLRRAFVER